MAGGTLSVMTTAEFIEASAVVVVAGIVAVGARKGGGWKSLTGYTEYQRGQQTLRNWWRNVFGRRRY